MYARLNNEGDIEFLEKRKSEKPNTTLYNEAAKKEFIDNLPDEVRKMFESGKIIRLDK
jgi:hypothetical protein